MAEPYGASGRSGEPGDICRIFAEGLLVQLIKEDGCGGGQPPRGARGVLWKISLGWLQSLGDLCVRRGGR